MSAALLSYLAARKRNNKARKKKAIDAVVEALKDDEERAEDKQRALDLRDRNAAANEARKVAQQEKFDAESCIQRWRRRIFKVLDMTSVQCLQYLLMILAFQSLASSMRIDSEFYMDKHIAARFVDKQFDAEHRRFKDITKVADVWEWAQHALEPGLFHNSEVGETFPDGDGPFSTQGATPLSVYGFVEESNSIRIESLVIKQVRMDVNTKRKCYTGHTCLKELGSFYDDGNTSSYGHGGYAGRFTWWRQGDLGCDPDGVISANPMSASLVTLRTYSPSGFVATFRPFFSDTWLEDESDVGRNVTAFHDYEATPSNSRQALYQCARSSINGHDVVQKCDPTPLGATGTLRQQFRDMLTELKRGRWVDRQTGLLSISLLVRNEHVGVRFYCRYLLEFKTTGSVLPSTDVETMLIDEELRAERLMWLHICMGIVMWFVLLELIELTQSGLLSYFSSGWNVLDWVNFAVFFLVYIFTLQEEAFFARDAKEGSCSAALCLEAGVYDPWQAFKVARAAKLYLSICVCIQFLKIIKFTNVLVPKMSLMTRVLSKGAADLLFFAIILFVALFAFANLFCVQLGHAIDDYTSVFHSVVVMVRSLFGDFNFPEIIENSPGSYVNAILFLVYLFVAVFILLALFLSILGEAQAAVRDDQKMEEDDYFAQGLDPPDEYGFIGEAGRLLQAAGALTSGFIRRRLGFEASVADEDEGLQEGNAQVEMGEEQRLVVDSLRQFRSRLVKSFGVHFDALEDTWSDQIAALQAQIAEKAAREREVKARKRELLSKSGRLAADGKTGVGRRRTKEHGGREKSRDGVARLPSKPRNGSPSKTRDPTPPQRLRQPGQ